jgi:hypothetical protein
MSKLARRIRQHRDARAFDHILRNASPSMQQELIALAAKSHTTQR